MRKTRPLASADGPRGSQTLRLLGWGMVRPPWTWLGLPTWHTSAARRAVGRNAFP
jgi:hypothetical protein